MEARPLELSELVDRQRWLIELRWTAAAGVTIIVAALNWLVGIDLQVIPLFAIAAFIALYNLAFWLYVRGFESVGGQRLADWRQGTNAASLPPLEESCRPDPRPLSPIQAHRAVVAANLQISLDLIALTLLLHFVGGVENPFFLYYVFHVIIASILLSREQTFLQATLAVALFAILASLEYQGLIPHVPVMELGTSGLYTQTLYVIAVLAAFTSTIYFAAYMATSIVHGLRSREAQMINLKEALEKEERELEEAYHKLQEVERFKSQYLRKVSHELRAPLSSIQSLITVVLEGFTGPIPDKPREILGRASVRTKELLDMVSDLLTLSRAREIRPEQVRQEISMTEIASRILPLFQAQAIDKGVDMTIDVDPDLPTLWADREGMEELLSNLVSNAIKYTPPGGKARASLSRANDGISITVSDTGIGMKPEEIPHVFEEFYRTKRARELVQEGTGLGMAIVKAIVDAHSGRVDVSSKEGEGTTVVVTLPRIEGGGLRSKTLEVDAEGEKVEDSSREGGKATEAERDGWRQKVASSHFVVSTPLPKRSTLIPQP